MKNQLFSDPNPSRQREILRVIRKQVMAEHEVELQQTKGWRKYWLNWKITLITQIKYRDILFLGMTTKLH